MPSSVYSCVHAHLPQVQWAGRKWVSQSYSFKGRDICVLSGPRTDAAVQSLTDPANDLLHARLPCPAPGHWAVQLQECHADHLHLPHAGVGPHQLDHVWFTRVRDVFWPQLPIPLTHRLIHLVRQKKASKRNRQSTAAAPLFLLKDVLEGYQQQDDPASVPLLTPHAGGGINPSPLRVVHGRPAFSRACAAVHGCSESAIVLLLPAGPVPDPDEYSVPEVVWMSNVPHDPHIAVTSLRDCGAVEQGSEVVYQPSCSATVWGAEYTTALDAIKSVCGCDLAWRRHAVYWPEVVLSPELTASSAASLGRVVQSPHSNVAWLEPHRYCWVPLATKVTSSDASPQGDDATNVAVASHGIPTWTGAIYGTIPEAEIIGAAAYLLHTPPSACTVQVVDASIIGAHLRRAQEALYRRIKGPTSHLVSQHALSWIMDGLWRLPRRVGGPDYWVLRQSSHLAAVPLEAPDSAAARAMAPPVHLVLPKEHAILLVPGNNGELQPRVPSMQALQQVREMEWRSLVARTRAHTHRNMLPARDGRLSTMQVMRRWRQKLTRMAIPAHPCIYCGGPDEDIGHMRLLCARDEDVAGLLCRRVEESTAELSLTDRAVEFVAWREHGCRWTESLMAGVVPGDLKRLFAAVRAALSRGPAKARLFVEDIVQIGEDLYARRNHRLTRIMQLPMQDRTRAVYAFLRGHTPFCPPAGRIQQRPPWNPFAGLPGDLRATFQRAPLHALLVPQSCIAHEEAMSLFPHWMAAVAQAFSQWIGSWVAPDFTAFKEWSRVVSAQSWALVRGTMVRSPDGQSDPWLQVYANHPAVGNVISWPREVLLVLQQPLCSLQILAVAVVLDVGTLSLYDRQLRRAIPAVTEQLSMAVLVGSKQLAQVQGDDAQDHITKAMFSLPEGDNHVAADARHTLDTLGLAAFIEARAGGQRLVLASARGPGQDGVHVIGEVLRDYGWELLAHGTHSPIVARWPRLIAGQPVMPDGRPILRPVSTWEEARRGLLSCATGRTLAGALLGLQDACCDVWQDLWSQCCDGSCVPSRSVLPQRCHGCREAASVWVHQCASVPLCETCKERADRGWPKARCALQHSGQMSSSSWKTIQGGLKSVRVEGVRCPGAPWAALPPLLWWAALEGDSRILWLWHHGGNGDGVVGAGSDAD